MPGTHRRVSHDKTQARIRGHWDNIEAEPDSKFD